VQVVGPDGLEPSTPRLSSVCSNQLSYEPEIVKGSSTAEDRYGGAGRIRTGDILLAKQALYQLSYDPILVDHVIKNRLLKFTLCDQLKPKTARGSFFDHRASEDTRLLRKEVIQPQVPLRLPCYDFVPITSLTLGRRLHCWLANTLRAKPAFMT
jgi:hypothetical protein